MIPFGTNLELHAVDLLSKRWIQGSSMGSTCFWIDMPTHPNLHFQGQLELDELVSRWITLDEIDAGFDALRTGSVARSVIRMGGRRLGDPALKRPLRPVDRPCMERFIALIVFVAAIYVASTVATEGLDHAFGGLFANEPQSAAEEVVRSGADDEAPAAPARRPITERVRVQVQGDVDDYSRRIGAE